MQSRRMSAIEVVTNTFTGTIGSLIITYACIRLIPKPEVAAAVCVVLCTLWSLARGYTIRRVFAKKEKKC